MWFTDVCVESVCDIYVCMYGCVCKVYMHVYDCVCADLCVTE